MKANTKKRIISAFVLAFLVISSLVGGKIPTLILLFIFGVICVDEIEVNFFKRDRKSWAYRFSQSVYSLIYIVFGFYLQAANNSFFIYACALMNASLVYFLFKTSINDKSLIKKASKTIGLPGLFITLPFMSTIYFLNYDRWQLVFGLLALVNFGMDTAAWFWGKNFGKHKLWPAVSPKKTIEGFVGGVVTSAALGILYSYYVLDKGSVGLFIVFMILGALSQTGDLIQSKIKRQIGIKDSSNLIPGHGGVYDRIDSIIFMAPFMAIFLDLFY